MATLTEMPPVEHNRQLDYHALNAMLNLYGPDGEIQFEKDRDAAREYFLQHVNPNTVFFHSLREKMDYLVENKYYEQEVLDQGVAPGLAPHKVMPGNRPSTTILAPALTPGVVGQLIALYEHLVFVQSAILGSNAYDQWGVELGKKQAGELLPVLTSTEHPGGGFDSSTDALVEIYRHARGRR